MQRSRGRGVRARKLEKPRPLRSLSSSGTQDVNEQHPCASALAELLEGDLSDNLDLALHHLDNLEIVGGMIDSAIPRQLDSLFLIIRMTLRKGGVPPVLCVRLLQLLELRARGWKMEKDTEEYYNTKVKNVSATVTKMKRHFSEPGDQSGSGWKAEGMRALQDVSNTSGNGRGRPEQSHCKSGGFHRSHSVQEFSSIKQSANSTQQTPQDRLKRKPVLSGSSTRNTRRSPPEDRPVRRPGEENGSPPTARPSQKLLKAEPHKNNRGQRNSTADVGNVNLSVIDMITIDTQAHYSNEVNGSRSNRRSSMPEKINISSTRDPQSPARLQSSPFTRTPKETNTNPFFQSGANTSKLISPSLLVSMEIADSDADVTAGLERSFRNISFSKKQDLLETKQETRKNRHNIFGLSNDIKTSTPVDPGSKLDTLKSDLSISVSGLSFRDQSSSELNKGFLADDSKTHWSKWENRSVSETNNNKESGDTDSQELRGSAFARSRSSGRSGEVDQRNRSRSRSRPRIPSGKDTFRGTTGNLQPFNIIREPIHPLTDQMEMAVIERGMSNDPLSPRGRREQFRLQDRSGGGFKVYNKPRTKHGRQYSREFLLSQARCPIALTAPQGFSYLSKVLSEVCMTEPHTYLPGVRGSKPLLSPKALLSPTDDKTSRFKDKIYSTADSIPFLPAEIQSLTEVESRLDI